jgi:hypothetical protein
MLRKCRHDNVLVQHRVDGEHGRAIACIVGGGHEQIGREISREGDSSGKAIFSLPLDSVFAWYECTEAFRTNLNP